MTTKKPGIMAQKRQEMAAEFLSLTPMERIRRADALFRQLIALKAKTSGLPEYEIYRRYLKPNR